MKGAAAIASILKREGVEYLFTFPQNPIIDTCAAVGIRPIMTRTERTAIALADAYARVSFGRKIGVIAVQAGPGVENAFGGVAQAYSDSTPLLVVPGAAAQSRVGQQPNFDAVLNYQHITKWAERFNTASRVPALMRRAFTYLRTGRPGPVLLELPADVAGAEVDDALVEQYKPVKGTRSQADPAAVAEAVQALLAAKKPLIHAGQGVLYAEAWDELRELAELLQLPVMTTLPGKSAFPENHPLSVGNGGHTGPRAAAEFMKEADLILGVGASLTVSSFAAPLPKGPVLIQATVDERDLNKDYPVDHLLLGDAKLVLRQLVEEVKRQVGPAGRQDGGKLAAAIKKIRDEDLAAWMPKLTSDQVPMNPYRVIWELMHAVDPANTIITHDAGTPRDMLSVFWQSVQPRGYVGWGKSTHLGYGLGLAMGAKLAAPDKICINLMGDGAFGMVGMEVETAARNRIPILTMLLNNSCLGGYQKAIPLATERYGTRFITGDYHLVAKGLGAYTERVELPEDIRPAVARAQKAMAEGQPALLELMTCEETLLSSPWG